MSKLAIRANLVSKLYYIQKIQRNRMLREQIQDAVKSGIKKISKFSFGTTRNIHRDKIWALKDISFDVNQGESIGIIGANGAGKTTLLRILARITAPTEGKIRMVGRVGSLLEVGTGFHAELTGRENVYLNGAILGMRKAEIERKFDEIVDFSGVEKFIDTPVKRFSTGMRMRLAFSVAAHLEPEILLVDEVLAVGDIAFQKKSLNKMEAVAKKGRTVLFVSHNLAAVKAFCSRSIFLEGGQLKFLGDTETAIQMYLKKNESSEENPDLDINHKLSAQILSIRPCDSQGSRTTSFPHDDFVYIRVKIYIQSAKYKPHLLLKLYNSDLETILATYDFESNGEFLIPSKPGGYEFQVRVPANLLVPGKFYLGAVISALTSKNRSRKFHVLDHASEFEIYDNGSLLSQQNISWQGMVHADVEWTRL